ncbi:uncharacterized protein LOC120774267 isoform X1 [Bactrocera tryoni]|uniref:uncharacterized protein LOC120774267 isoform X1 n=1 Tax=Bactrocera tryoni TaxID=59916 RepID=UPI001A98604C|nr:uncharacterized protein LOC120774267 isoform X1 [Bactrocera tryoni]XP_039959677.1 uncharacterized protein LOC120774267 isoform X1 [Bactrocera tryoni]XP_039959678.1 uncharacterized protein LOC120774267 isoform X1 [Bactrocera tryoni]XP_039959679.1 uncharacterized protein LOC120774267 isoform X1 [Bactrocera tryoni]
MMKHKGSSYCCRWFTLFLLAMGIVLVSPDIHTNFADNNKQTTTKGTTANTTTTIMSTTTTTRTTTMQANTLRTMKMLEAMGFIDANRYNVNDKNNNNNNNFNNYHSNLLIANGNRNSKNSNKMYISAPSRQELWRQQLQQLADRALPAEKVEPKQELEQELEEHMVSTPQSMTIMVEKPTTSPAAAAATTTTTITNPTKIATKMLSVSTATTLAASKPTTTTITIATSAITTRHSGSTIKLPPDNMANINVSGINAKGTMIYKQQRQWQHEERKQQQQQKQQHERQHQQQQPQHTQTLVVVAGNRSAKQPQKYIGHTLLGDSGSTHSSAAMIVATPVRRGGELANVTATAQTQIAINGKSNSNSNSNSNNNNNRNSNDIVDGITTPITAVTTRRITVVDTFIITPTPSATTTKTLRTQSKQFESARISYDYKATDANDVTDATDDLKRTTETDAPMIAARHEEMEVVRQYQHKFSSSYLDAAGNRDHAAAANYGNTQSFAALVQMSAKQQEQQQRQQQQRSRWVRQAEEEPIDKCRKFNEGDAAKNEFYSPDYPNDYPKNISCTRVIKAPPGQIIRLDFRNSFHIEAKEECKFDVLEIRDGQYGFSNLLGKYCGTDFPPEITSKERYLWLHFQSDESIEYSGFTAVFEFMDRSKEAPSTDLNCTIEKSGFEDFVNSTDVPEDIRDTAIKNRVPLDCIWHIQVQENWKIQMKFVDFRLVKPNDCEANFLDIFPEQTIMPLRKKNFCGSAGEGITSDSNTLNIRFFAEPAAINSTFSILFTAFRDKGSGSCTDEEYDCEDATCIDRKLKCNSRDNCKFRWDEEGCNKETAEGSEHIYIIMVVFGLILGGMILTFLVNCIRKIMHDQKIIREHIRQSKESKLNELGRNSKARSRENLSSTMPRPKHSQTSLQILNDASNRYYREVVPMSRASSKSDLKEREHSILRQRNDIVVQTSFCVDDNSSEATVEAALAANACDMGCQTRESLFATPLMHQNSMGSLKDKASLHSRSRFSTFGYETAQPTPPPPSQQPASARGGQLTGLNIRDAREYIEMRERHPGPKPKMPHMHRMDALPPTPPTPAAPAEMCHHHHQHAAHTHVHTQQQQQSQAQQQQSAQQQQQLSMQPSKESAGGGGGGRSTAAATTTVTTATSAQGKGKPKLSQSTAYIDIRNSAPDVIIMTSH